MFIKKKNIAFFEAEILVNTINIFHLMKKENLNIASEILKKIIVLDKCRHKIKQFIILINKYRNLEECVYREV